MPLQFNIGHITRCEFHISVLDGEERRFFVPIDNTVQPILGQTLRNTIDALGDLDTLPQYEFSEKYASCEPLQKLLMSDGMDQIQELFNIGACEQAAPIDNIGQQVNFYFVKFIDNQQRCLMGFRRASYFKTLLSKQSFLIQWANDSLRALEDQILKIDERFDFIVDQTNCYILYPTGFVQISRSHDLILESAEHGVREIGEQLTFMNLDSVATMASQRRRMAQTIAGLRSRNDLNRISQARVLHVAQENGVELIQLPDGRYTPANGQEQDFLDLLDYRRYSISLIDEEETSRFVAGSRRRVTN